MSSTSVKQRLRKRDHLKAELSEEQHRARQRIENNAISIILGKAGTGKTFLACFIACQKFLNNEVDKIVITRPTVTQEEIGFLPGSVEEKLDPWIKPIYNNLYQIFGREMINQMDEEDYLQVVPVSFMRGRTFSNAAVIVDEFQNLKPIMVKMIMSRIGMRSTMMFTGDQHQVDLDHSEKSGYEVVKNGIENINDICKINLKNNYRHPVLDDLLDYFDELNLNNDNDGRK